MWLSKVLQHTTLHFVYMLKKWKRAANNGKLFGILLTILTGKGYDGKVGAGPWDPGTRDPGSSSKFKVGLQDPPQSLKVGPS